MHSTKLLGQLLLIAIPVGLGACSDANAAPVDRSVDASNSAASSQTAAGHEGHEHGFDPAHWIQRFDKDKSGAVEANEVPPRLVKWFEKADANHDGKVTVEELKALKEHFRKEMFDRQDKNKDGALTADEVGEEHWARLKVADANSDGRVTQAEIEQAIADGKLQPFHPHGDHDGGGHPGREWFAHLDKNSDGAITADEVPAKLWERIQVADANGDKRITQEELKQAHESGKLPRGPHPRGHQDEPSK